MYRASHKPSKAVKTGIHSPSTVTAPPPAVANIAAGPLPTGVTDPTSALNLAQRLANDQRLDEAQTILALYPNHPECIFRRAGVLMTLERPAEAEPLFRRLQAMAPKNFEVAMGLAGALVETGRAAEAMPWLDAAVKAARSPRTLYCRGVALSDIGQDNLAEQDLAEARDIVIRGVEARGMAPLEVYVQIARRCNLRCAMCGHDVWKSNSGFMEPDVFDRVLAECAANGVKTLHILSGQGEPMLHPHVFDFLDKAVATGMDVGIVTNGTPLTDERCRRLAATGLSYIQFSFAGWDKETYEGTYVGAKFERTLENLKRMGEYTRGTKTNFMVKAVCTGDNWSEVRDKTRTFLQAQGVERVVTVVANNFGGNVTHGRRDDRHGVWSLKNLSHQRLMPCRVFLKAVGVFCDGTVTACGCYDSNAELKIGDITKQSLADIRKGEQFRRILDAFRAGDVSEIPMCSKCDDPYG